MASVHLHHARGSTVPSNSMPPSEAVYGVPGYRGVTRSSVGRSVDGSLPARASYKMTSYTEDAVKTTLDEMDDVMVKQAFKGKAEVSNNALDGIWVSREFWRTVRRQLEEKIVECSDLKEQLQRKNRLHDVEMRASFMKRMDTEDQLKGVERHFQSQVTMEQRKAQGIEAEMYSKEEQYRQQIRELSAQVEDLSRRLKQKENLVHDIEDQRKQISESQLAVRMEQHRSSMADSRIKALENDLEHQREREMGAHSRAQVLEKRVLDLGKECADAKATAMMYREQLQDSVKPNHSMGREIHRLQVDNKRLLALLEHTEDFRKYVQDKALSKGLHYIPLAECFAMEQTVGAVYPPEHDRHIALPTEEYNWVPRDIINSTVDFLMAHFPDQPVQPFMAHLVEINKVWRVREEAKLREVRREHKAEVRALRTAQRRAQPYTDVMYKQKLEWTKKELRKKDKKVKKLATYRRELDGAHKAEPGAAWTVHAIENLTDRMGSLATENAAIRRQVTGTLSHFQSAVTSSPPSVRSGGEGGHPPTSTGAGMHTPLAHAHGGSTGGSPPYSPGTASPPAAYQHPLPPAPTSAPMLALPLGTMPPSTSMGHSALPQQSSRVSIASAPARSAIPPTGVPAPGGSVAGSESPVRDLRGAHSMAGVAAAPGTRYASSEVPLRRSSELTRLQLERGGVPLPPSVVKFQRRDSGVSSAV